MARIYLCMFMSADRILWVVFVLLFLLFGSLFTSLISRLSVSLPLSCTIYMNTPPPCPSPSFFSLSLSQLPSPFYPSFFLFHRFIALYLSVTKSPSSDCPVYKNWSLCVHLLALQFFTCCHISGHWKWFTYSSHIKQTSFSFPIRLMICIDNHKFRDSLTNLVFFITSCLPCDSS